jgi:quinol monooxygenase YgiN
MKALYAEFTAIDDECADRVGTLLSDLVVAVRAEPGNLAFDAFRLHDRSNSFFVYELYRDDEAFSAHLGQQHGRVFNEKLAGLVIGGRSELTFLEPISPAPINPAPR